MALASCPARQGQQRSLRKIRQVIQLGICTLTGRGAGHYAKPSSSPGLLQLVMASSRTYH